MSFWQMPADPYKNGLIFALLMHSLLSTIAAHSLGKPFRYIIGLARTQ
jgi:hypothetical protein